jgi:hypothetical protein
MEFDHLIIELTGPGLSPKDSLCVETMHSGHSEIPRASDK